MRLDRWISNNTALSRQAVRMAVKAKQVQVNGVLAARIDQPVNESDTVLLNGEPVQLQQARYFMLHKPAGYVCANEDSHYPVVLDLLDEQNKHTLQIAGRLDLDTTGLVLITDDGQWNHRVTSPTRLCQKTYHVRLDTPLTDVAADQLRSGVLLQHEKKPTQAAELVFVDEHDKKQVLLSIHEGKYHQVKRMFTAVGFHVIALHRQRVGTMALGVDLQPGQYRPLTAAEIASV
jgi:16S rRNA pseudouridine516 synthase